MTVTRITYDGNAFRAAIAELSAVAGLLRDAPPQFVERVLLLLKSGDDLIRLETPDAASAAGELRVRSYPTDRLLHLLEAVRAGNFDLAIFEHDLSSVGGVDSSSEDRAPGESQGSPGACLCTGRAE